MAEMERTEILGDLLKENNTSLLKFKEFPGTIIGKVEKGPKPQVESSERNRTRKPGTWGQLLGATQPLSQG